LAKAAPSEDYHLAPFVRHKLTNEVHQDPTESLHHHDDDWEPYHAASMGLDPLSSLTTSLAIDTAMIAASQPDPTPAFSGGGGDGGGGGATQNW
jgi:uncharacterized membrane protein YgcG